MIAVAMNDKKLKTDSKLKIDFSSKVIAKNIKNLMAEDFISESELARQTDLPQTTINRLLLGITIDPRANTLIPIARYFGVTVDYILGQDTADHKRIPGTRNQNNPSSWHHIPIIEWQDILSWPFKKKNYTPSSHGSWITTENDVSDTSFALKSLSFMEPRFRRGSIIIVDPKFDVKDGNHVIVSIGNAEPTVRKVIKDGSEIHLIKLYQRDNPVKIKKSDTIIGTIVETRINERS